MWLAEELKHSCDILNDCQLVSEVILIDNNHTSTSKPDFTKYGLKEELGTINLYQETFIIYKHGKFKIVETKENIFTSKSWNIGHTLSDSEILCLLNDDVVVGPKTYNFVSSSINEEVGIIGINDFYFSQRSNQNLPIKVQPIDKRPNAFGCCMFMLRKKYSEIPETLKVWYNDDWLMQKISGVHIVLVNADITGRVSVTVSTNQTNRIKQAIAQDHIEWRKLKDSRIVN